MPRWRDALAAPALLLATAPVTAADGTALLSDPAPATAAIVAGGKAAIGTTLKAAGQGARIASRLAVTLPTRDQMHTDGSCVAIARPQTLTLVIANQAGKHAEKNG